MYIIRNYTARDNKGTVGRNWWMLTETRIVGDDNDIIALLEANYYPQFSFKLTYEEH